MLNLKVDSETKSLSMELMLKGEFEQLNVAIGKYSIIEEDDKLFLKIEELSTNREWLNIIIDTYLKENKIELPKKYASLLEIAL
jgi:hypothetical protein